MLKPIAQTYRGITFRSRTEARWAVFFDSLGIPWQYEAEGFELPSGRYLPDFLLTLGGAQGQVWFEVKGQELSSLETTRAVELASASSRPVFTAVGVPVEAQASDDFDVFYEFSGDGGDGSRKFCTCAACGAVGIFFEADADRMQCCPDPHDRPWGVKDERIAKALDDSRTFSFWSPA